MPKQSSKEEPTEPERCLNCGTPLTGSYCAHCGQKATNRNVPLRELLGDFLNDVLTFDSRFFRTLKPLLLKPGYLTKEYLAGRRVRYVPPLRLYLFTSFVFFLLLALFSSSSPWPPEAGGAEPPMSPSTRADVAAADSVLDSLKTIWPLLNQDSANVPIGRIVQRGAERVQENPARFVSNLIGRLSGLVFVLLPVFAFVLKALYVRSRQLYVQHLIFSLHVHAFVFILLTATELIGQIVSGAAGETLTLVTFYAMLLYLFVAMWRTYDQSIGKTAVKMGLLLTTYSLLFAAAFVVLVILTMLLL